MLHIATFGGIWRAVRFVVIVSAFILFAERIPASSIAPAPLQPQTIPSPNGRFVFALDPSDRNGAGSSTVTIQVDGKQTWSGTIPFTFWKADATDEGQLVGFGYSNGYDAISGSKPGAPEGAIEGEIIAAALDTEGKVVMAHRRDRRQVLVLDVIPSTIVRKHVIDRVGRRLLLILDDERHRSTLVRLWIVPFDPAGEPVELRPLQNAVEDQAPYLDGVYPLNGSPLIVLDYWTRSPDWRQIIRHVALMNLDGSISWEWSGSPVAPSRGGWLIAMAQPDRQFTIYLDDTREQVTFEAVQADGKWTAKEIARTPSDRVEPNSRRESASAADMPTSATDFPMVTPQLLGNIRLQLTGEQESPIRISPAPRSFAIDEQGRFAFIRRGPTLTILSPDGKIAKEVELKKLADEKRHVRGYFGSGGNGIYVATVSEPSWDYVGGPAFPCVVNSETGEVTILDSIKLWGVYSLAAGHGMFVYTGWKDADINKGDIVSVHKVSGELLWSIDQLDTGTTHRMFVPEDVAVTSDGKIALLCKYPDAVYLFDAGGSRVAAWNLETAWGRKPNYVSSLIPDHDGAIIVEDFHGLPAFVRMTAEGKLARQFDLPTRWSVVDPAGNLWYTDEYTLRRLNNQLEVDRVVGHLPAAEEIGDLAATAIGDDGMIFLMARRTNLIHVFAPDGTKLRTIKPASEDTPAQSDLRLRYTLTPLGDSSLALTSGSRITVFGENGERSRSDVLPLDSYSPELIAQPKSGNCWTLEYHAIRLLSPGGGSLKKIERRRDGRWIGSPTRPLVSDDGSLLFFDDVTTGLSTAHVYDPDGSPRSSFRLAQGLSPFAPATFRRDLLVTATVDLISGLHEDGTPAFQFKVAHPDGKQVSWQPFLVANGSQIWLYDGASVIVKVRTP